MSAFLARRQYNTPILYIGVQRIACTDIEAAPKWPRKNDLSLRGDFGLHGKTILPSWRRFRNASSSYVSTENSAQPVADGRAPQPNRSSRGNSAQYGRSNFAQNLQARNFSNSHDGARTQVHSRRGRKILGPINNSTLAPEKNIFLADFVENVYFPFLESEGMKEVALNHGARETAQGSLRHANPQVLLDRYARSVTDEMVAAQGRFLEECGMGVERKLLPQPATDRIQNAGA
jgi:hypothetical protein